MMICEPMFRIVSEAYYNNMKSIAVKKKIYAIENGNCCEVWHLGFFKYLVTHQKGFIFRIESIPAWAN